MITQPKLKTNQSAKDFLCRVFFSNPYQTAVKRGDDYSSLKYLTTDRQWQVWSDRDAVIAPRPGNLTYYVMFDLDWKEDKKPSQFHPLAENNRYGELVAALEGMGFCRGLLVKSSDRGAGLHLYYPLIEPVRSYRAAIAIRDYLQSQGITLAAGQLEMFPNVKGWNNAYNAHRAPLQQGSYLVDEELTPKTAAIADFISAWDIAAAGQDYALLWENLETYRGDRRAAGFGSKTAEAAQRLERGYTQEGQTNDLIMAAGFLGRCRYGLEGVKLQRYVYQRITTAPGYDRFASEDSKKRIDRWAVDVANHYERRHPVVKSITKLEEKTKAGDTNLRRQQDAADRIRRGLHSARQLIVEHKIRTFRQLLEHIERTFQVSRRTLYKGNYLQLLKTFFKSLVAATEPNLLQLRSQLDAIAQQLSPIARLYSPWAWHCQSSRLLLVEIEQLVRTDAS